MAMKAEAALTLAKKYVKQTLSGMGALKGKNCQVQSIVNNDDGTHVITFAWYNDNDVLQTEQMVVVDGDELPYEYIEKAVKEYMDENPVDMDKYALKEEVPEELPNRSVVEKLGEDENGNLLFNGESISSDVDLSQYSTTEQVQEYVAESIENKVDKIDGKSLSTNDFTDVFKDYLEKLLNGTLGDFKAINGDFEFANAYIGNFSTDICMATADESNFIFPQMSSPQCILVSTSDLSQTQITYTDTTIILTQILYHNGKYFGYSQNLQTLYTSDNYTDWTPMYDVQLDISSITSFQAVGDDVMFFTSTGDVGIGYYSEDFRRIVSFSLSLSEDAQAVLPGFAPTACCKYADTYIFVSDSGAVIGNSDVAYSILPFFPDLPEGDYSLKNILYWNGYLIAIVAEDITLNAYSMEFPSSFLNSMGEADTEKTFKPTNLYFRCVQFTQNNNYSEKDTICDIRVDGNFLYVYTTSNVYKVDKEWNIKRLVSTDFNVSSNAVVIGNESASVLIANMTGIAFVKN